MKTAINNIRHHRGLDEINVAEFMKQAKAKIEQVKNILRGHFAVVKNYLKEGENKNLFSKYRYR